MDSLIIINDLLITLYFCWGYVKNDGLKFWTILIASLLYLSIKVSYFLIKNKKIKEVILISLCILLLVLTKYVDHSFALLIPINIYMLLIRRSLSMSIFSLPIIFYATNVKVTPILILICAMNLLFIFVYYRYSDRIMALREENDRLSNSNAIINGKLIKSEKYEREVEELTKLTERNNIAQEIHDSIGHTLAGSIMQLEAVKVIYKTDEEKTEQMINNIIEVLKSGMDRIRLTLREIKPPAQEIGIHRLKQLIFDLERNSDIQVYLSYDEYIDRISNNQWKVMINNSKEAITNAIKYSQASRINISIETLNRYTKIEIRDDGIGTPKIIKGLGLLGMEERTDELGGKLIIDGSSGFSIIMLLPYD